MARLFCFLSLAFGVVGCGGGQTPGGGGAGPSPAPAPIDGVAAVNAEIVRYVLGGTPPELKP